MGITGNMVGVWPVNAKGKPVRNAILWNDARSKEIFDKIQNNNPKIYQKIFDLTGSIVQFGCTIPVIKWLEKNEPQTIKKTDYFLTCKDWIRFNLTNEFNNDHTERAVAPGDIKKADLSLKIFKLLKLNKKYLNKFPQVKKSQDIAGYITNNAAKETGLLSGTQSLLVRVMFQLLLLVLEQFIIIKHQQLLVLHVIIILSARNLFFFQKTLVFYSIHQTING